METIIQQIQKELSKSIRVSHQITSKVGTKINVGEQFKVKFKLTNRSPYKVKITHLQVYDTLYAKVVGTHHDATDRVLAGRAFLFPIRTRPFAQNTANSIEFTMEAIDNLTDDDTQEKFARVRVSAQFYPEDIFSIVKTESEYTNIDDPT